MAEGQSDFEKVQEFIKEQVKSNFDTIYAEHQRSNPQPVQQTQQPTVTDPNDQVRKQIGDTVRSFVSDDINLANFNAADARDYTEFYHNNPLGWEYKQQVEETFELLKKNGRPTKREDILDYLRGKEQRVDPAKYEEREKTRRAKELDRASTAGDIGIGSIDKAKNDPQWSNFEKLSLEEQEKLLDGVTF